MSNTHLKPRTIREWLELIPFDRARREAIDNLDTYTSDVYHRCLSDAIAAAFRWSTTPQCGKYWEDLRDSIRRMEQSVKLKQPK